MKTFEIPDTKDECLLQNKKAKSLNGFATLFEVVGIILAVLNLLFGILLALGVYAVGIPSAAIPSDSAIVSIVIIILTIIISVVIYLKDHLIAILLRSFAEVVQNTYVSANISTYSLYNKEEEPKEQYTRVFNRQPENSPVETKPEAPIYQNPQEEKMPEVYVAAAVQQEPVYQEPEVEKEPEVFESPVVQPIPVEEPVQASPQEYSIPQYDLPQEFNCPNCGSKVLPSDMFCIKCGTKLK